MSEVSTGAIKGSNSLSEESRDAITSTKDLKRVLGRKELLAIAIGETIGAGVFALTGVVIGISGRSVVLCFLLSAILVMITAVPYIFAGGTVRLRGGQYTQAALFFGKKFAGIYIIIFLLRQCRYGHIRHIFRGVFGQLNSRPWRDIPSCSHWVSLLLFMWSIS